jgi:hypothetical protein
VAELNDEVKETPFMWVVADLSKTQFALNWVFFIREAASARFGQPWNHFYGVIR